VSLLGTGLWNIAPDVLASVLLGKDPRQAVGIGAKSPPNPLVGIYRSSDQRFVMLNMLQADRYWPGFCHAIGREDLIEHPEYADFEARSQHRQELFTLIRDAFAAQPVAHWREQLTKHDCVWSAVQTPAEAADDPQSVANGYLAQHPTNPRGRVVASPVQYNEGTLELERGAPELGQHTEEVLQELGFDWDAIAKLKEQGVVT
jgi:crotonobetainyl-CoA:carnitine CoA-transferase CaiB-like acyl-CoA transferase